MAFQIVEADPDIPFTSLSVTMKLVMYIMPPLSTSQWCAS
jgi:hypothetical protein